MNTYLLIKTLHILSSVLMVGTGFGSAFYLFFTHRTRNVQAIAEVSRLVVRADTWFTAPAVVFQPLSGWYLASQAGWTLDTPWIAAALGLYALAGACWLPVVALQIRMRNTARAAVQAGTPLPPAYWRDLRIWTTLGVPAFFAFLALFYLMVAKPAW